MASFSKGQIDRLGSRLRRDGPTDPDDAAMYVDWSATFDDALREVEAFVVRVAERADVPLSERTGRIKQLYSVIAKLRRMPTKLSGLDDIAGVRAVMQSERDVNALLLQLATARNKRVRDYRQSDRNGYRAVHLTLLSEAGSSVELQLRTEIQHVWAGLSERRAAVVGHEVKYGGGPQGEQDYLRQLSANGRRLDLWQVSLDARLDMVRSGGMAHTDEPQMPDLNDEMRRLRSATEDFIAICRGYASIQGTL
jgi:ppGpp synthetase/RelA/SpoT-type nucleotidyltranferase